MKKLVYGVTAFALASAAATMFVWWDTAPAKTSAAKYRLGGKENLGLIVYQAPQAGPAIWKFECVGSEKDCGPSAKVTPAVVNTVPEPGTLALLGLGLAGLAWRSRR